MVSNDTIRRRVRKGAAYLDEHLPKTTRINRTNWRKKITDDLMMEDMDQCVLGQVFGNYCDGLVKLAKLNGAPWVDENGDDAMKASVSHGFNLNKNNGDDWSRLEVAWRKELALGTYNDVYRSLR